MKRLILFILLLASVLAVTEEELKEVAQSVVDSPVGGLVSGQAVNIYIGDDIFHLVVVDEEITDVGEGLIDEPTMNAYANPDAVDKLLAREITIVEALENKDITYEGVGVINSMKSGASKLFMKVYLWFN